MEQVLVYFTETEAVVIGRLAMRMAAAEGEDIIGTLMKMGAFTVLRADEVVKLAKKLEQLAHADTP